MIWQRQAPLLFAILFICYPAWGADSWTRFRGPSGDGHAADGANPPVEFGSEDNIAWRTDLPGQGWSSPVIQDGKVYLSAAIENSDEGFDLSLLILDAGNGNLLKTAKLLSQKTGDTPKIHKKNSHASPTPVIRGDRIFVHFGYQGTVCADLDGNVLWENRELSFPPVHGNGGSPALVDEHLIFTCDGAKDPRVVALNVADGKVAWETERPVQARKKFSFSTPKVIEVAGQTQVIAPGSDCVIALDPSTGDIIWEVRYSGYSVVPKPIFESQMLLMSTGFDQASLLAIRPDGSGDVTETHVEWEMDRNVPRTSSLIANDGLVYSISDTGIILCLQAANGEQVYQKRIGGNFSASPVLAGDHIYFTSEAGVTTVIKTGEEFEKLADNDLGERTLSSAAIVGNAIFMRTADALYRFEQSVVRSP